MRGMRTGVLLVALSLVVMSAPAALAHDHYESLPPCEEVTDEETFLLEGHHVRTNEGAVEIWEEDNGEPGLQTEECLDGDPIEENVVEPDTHEATLPDDVPGIALDAIDEAIQTGLGLAETAVELALALCSALNPNGYCTIL